jgi:hypothetical protein
MKLASFFLLSFPAIMSPASGQSDRGAVDIYTPIRATVPILGMFACATRAHYVKNPRALL